MIFQDNENLHIFDEKLIEDMENSNVEYDYKGVFIDGVTVSSVLGE